MPRGDRSGPDGAGPMTGRRMGYCARLDAPGYVRTGGGYGGGRGRNMRGRGGRGMMRRRGAGYGAWGPGWDAYGGVPAGAYPGVPPVVPVSVRPLTPGEETEALKAQAEYLEEALKDVQRRLNDMQKED